MIDDIFKYHFALGLYAKYKRVNSKSVSGSKKILANTDILVDISGYALGSDWSLASTLYYTSKIKTASKYGIKVYLMPQSFGPFDYTKIISPFINKIIKSSLKSPSIIFARENEGLELLTNKYKLENVELSPDLVLQNESLNMGNIYRKAPIIRDLDIKKDSVAIVPNMKNFKHGNKDEVIKLYIKAINRLLELGKNIYIVRHSFEDIEACEAIKSEFPNKKEVVLLTDEYSCLEYDNLVKSFDYIIASRYHSIVHAYREGVPCIALGWATKYHELLDRFNQSDYIFDVREGIEFEKFISGIDKINQRHSNEKRTLKKALEEIQNHNVFTKIEL